ncbi:MAG TPA: S8 family serine peptidase [Longimicrobium sp.]|jgi:subtilisin family serine protease|uniref:S8 family peptidase n=1 Tax=Longimicrobium sp. TaxID=2029185 RepID=UPI002EDBAAD7
MKRTTFALASLVALAACSDGETPLSADAGAPVLSQSASGRYVVVLNDDADPRSVAAIAGVSPRYVYTAALKGFAGTLNAGQLNALQNNPNVRYIEADLPMQASTIQTGATWGIDRIDQRSLPLSTSFSYTNTGAGVNAYILDTGIRLSHTDFAGRAVSGFDAVDGGSADDCNGHGTHVAGSVGGTLYGVAKGVKLVAVRVLDCAGSGTTSGVVAGIDWVTANHVKPATANMSLGGGASTAIDDAVTRSVAAGVSYGVAAGNGNRAGRQDDACKYSPARVPSAITVGATTSTDAKASYSNYGTCVDIFAPGSSIKSAWYTGDTATNTISGTSMATPHVVGVISLFLQSNPGASPAAVEAAIEGNATVGKVTSAGTGSPNLLLFTAY